jgi:8-oxo-dGTP pyrophosphatase MutT (NUDIX family)
LTEESFLGRLSARLTGEQPARLVPRRSAAVAVIFFSHADEKVLLIRRAEREGDPWSGQVAFPGGMVSSTDGSFEATARRETSEEVGIDLSAGTAAFLGYMGEFKARTREVVVVPSIFRLAAAPTVELNGEVASYLWAPLRELARKEARSTYILPRGDVEIAFPSLVHRSLVVWGLTERILTAIVQGRTDAGDDRVLGNLERY